LFVCEDDTFPAKSPGAGPGDKVVRGTTERVTTDRSRPTLASGVDLAMAIDAFLSQHDLASAPSASHVASHRVAQFLDAMRGGRRV